MNEAHSLNRIGNRIRRLVKHRRAINNVRDDKRSNEQIEHLGRINYRLSELTNG